MLHPAHIAIGKFKWQRSPVVFHWFVLLCRAAHGIRFRQVPYMGHADMMDMEKTVIRAVMLLLEVLETPGLRFYSETGSTKSGPERCLSFVHIPKTGGTSIEIEGFELKFYSNMSSNTVWGAYSHSFGCSGRNFTCGYGPPDGPKGVCCNVTGGGFCSAWHIPPSWDDKVAFEYENTGCDTFCVVRDPVERMISQWKFETHPNKAHCNAQTFELHIKERLAAYAKHRTENDCHYAPQVDYVFSQNHEKRYCTHVIDFSNLVQGFNDLMRSFDIPLWLRKHYKAANCGVAVEDVPSSVQEFIRTFYQADVASFGYRAI